MNSIILQNSNDCFSSDHCLSLPSNANIISDTEHISAVSLLFTIDLRATGFRLSSGNNASEVVLTAVEGPALDSAAMVADAPCSL